MKNELLEFYGPWRSLYFTLHPFIESPFFQQILWDAFVSQEYILQGFFCPLLKGADHISC